MSQKPVTLATQDVELNSASKCTLRCRIQFYILGGQCHRFFEGTFQPASGLFRGKSEFAFGFFFWKKIAICRELRWNQICTKLKPCPKNLLCPNEQWDLFCGGEFHERFSFNQKIVPKKIHKKCSNWAKKCPECTGVGQKLAKSWPKREFQS